MENLPNLHARISKLELRYKVANEAAEAIESKENALDGLRQLLEGKNYALDAQHMLEEVSGELIAFLIRASTVF